MYIVKSPHKGHCIVNIV